MSKPTHYEVLGIARSSSEAELRAAYRKLVMIHHPDRSKDPNATTKFIAITEAYEVLIDPARRSSYNRLIDLDTQTVKPPQKSPQPPRASRPPSGENKTSPFTEFKDRSSSPVAADVMRLTMLMSRGRYVDAETLARETIRREPTHPIPYAVLADLARIRGEYPEAAKLYAYAAQMDPGNALYQRKHEEMLRSTTMKTATTGGIDVVKLRSSMAVLAAVNIIAYTYLIMSTEPARFTKLGPISTWTLGLLGVLIVCGLAMGSAFAVGGIVDRFVSAQGSAVARVSPTAVLGLIALLNFWVAALLYVFVGVSQNVFNGSTSRFMAGVAATTCLLTLVTSTNPMMEPLQVLAWGGNLVYIGGLIGWYSVDALRS